MKRSVLLLAALFAVFSVQADNRPQAVLKQLTAALGALEGYSVVFEVHTDGDVVPGYYEVSGDNYYMHVNGQEVYGDAEFRYEIDPDRKEVVIDRVDLTSHNLLNNPTRAFDFIDREYAASLLSEKGSTAVIRLTPLRIQSAVGQIDVEVDTARSLPTAVTGFGSTSVPSPFTRRRPALSMRRITPGTSGSISGSVFFPIVLAVVNRA